MLTDAELDRLFAERKTPDAGRRLIREIRTVGPVRNLQMRMDTVRTRFISAKMSRALYAESRTVELPAVVFRENDKQTIELWPQACKLDVAFESSTGKKTRVQHTPDLFLITDTAFVMEEWRTEARLLGLAVDRPNHFYKDDSGRWHYLPIEEHLAKLGIDYYLRSAEEHPRSFLANISFLEDYSLETAPPVPDSEAQRLTQFMKEHKHIPHLELVYDHKFKADHIFQMVLDGRVYVDLHNTTLSRTDELVVYSDEVVARADAMLRINNTLVLPSSAYQVRIGSRFLYDGKPYEVVLLGKQDVICREPSGNTVELNITLVEKLFQREMLVSNGEQTLEQAQDLDALVLKDARLKEAMSRLDAIRNPEAAEYSERSMRRFRAAIRGITTPQGQLQALMSANEGNRRSRLPDDVIEMAEKALKKHNTPANPTIFSTFNIYVSMCDDAGIEPMGQTAFYRWVKQREDVGAREGKRKKTQQDPIPLTYDYDHPVHGVLAHEVAYCDHTVANVFLKGMRLPNLGKPTLTVMVDGAMTKPRAFYLSYQPPSSVSVLMCLRDYVRRNGRLPRVLVLDNGREFHSEALKLFCSLFGIDIRWRRRSRPRDSTMVERMLGATEQEVISSLEGNSIAMKDPRMVSGTHHPDKHIKWTLPALHGSIEHYLFNIYPGRIHPRLGMSPNDFERRQVLELGAREHVMVRYDTLFKLLTSPHPSARSTRVVDRIRGVYVDGQYYWNDLLRTAKKDEQVEVRVELWHARVVYLNFRGQWMIGQARDGGRLEGRFRGEYELQRREEVRRSRTAATNDKRSAKTSHKKAVLWTPEVWDPRLREQYTEEYYLYDRLGMTEALPLARNGNGTAVDLPLPRGSDLDFIRAIAGEPDALPVATYGDAPIPSAPWSSPLRAVATQAPVPEVSASPDEDYF